MKQACLACSTRFKFGLIIYERLGILEAFYLEMKKNLFI